MGDKMSEILRELRASRGLTQSDIAKLLGLTTNAYQSYERGTSEPSCKSLSKLADFYGVTTDYLLGRNPEGEWSTLMGKAFGSQEALERFSELKEEAKTVIIAAMVELGRIAQEGNEEPHDKEAPK